MHIGGHGGAWKQSDTPVDPTLTHINHGLQRCRVSVGSGIGRRVEPNFPLQKYCIALKGRLVKCGASRVASKANH